MMACGSRTGLNTPQEGPPTGLSVSGFVQCGYCLSRPWCYGGARPGVGAHAIVDCVGGPGGDPGCDATSCPPAAWIGTPVEAANLDGSTRMLYCVRQNRQPMSTLPATQPEMLPPVNQSVDAAQVSACTLSDREYLSWTGRSQLPWSSAGFTRQDWCHVMPSDVTSTGQYACNRIGDDSSHPTAVFSQLAPAECGKRAQMSANLRVCVTNDNAGGALANRLLATYAAAFSSSETYRTSEVAARNWTALTPLRTAPYMCLVRRGFNAPTPVAQDCIPVAAPAPNLPIPFDPGIAPDGYLFQAASGSQIQVTWNTQTATIAISGIASAEIESGAGGFRLTELRLTQSAPAQLSSGVTITNGRVDLENLWEGHVTGSSVVVQQATSWVQASVKVAGAPQNLRMIAQTSPTGTWSGGVLNLNGTWRDDANNITYVVTLHLTQSQFRPSATISSVSEVEPACRRYPDGFVGADVTVVGGLSTPTGQWGVAAGNTFLTLAPVIAPPTGGPLAPTLFDLPLLGPDDPPAGIMLSATDGPLTAIARRSDVRVVDHVAPTIIQTSLDIPCRWFAPERTKCLAVPGQFNDNCSSTTGEVVGGWAYNSAWQVIYTAPNPKCLVAPPEALIPNVYVYLMAYRARDAWRNVSATRYVLFTVAHDPPTDPACIEHLSPVLWWEWE